MNRDLAVRMKDLEAQRWDANWPGQALVKIGDESVEPVFACLLGMARTVHNLDWVAQHSAFRATLIVLGEHAVPFLESASYDIESAFADADLDVRIQASLLLRAIRRESPREKPVTTTVRSVLEGGDRVIVDAGEDAGTFVGCQLVVYREQSVSYIATIEIVRASSGGSTARVLFVAPGEKVTPGDAASTIFPAVTR